MALVGNISGSGGTASTIGISGSVIFGKVDNPSSFPKFGDPGIGSDVIFFVSGNVSQKPSASPNTAIRGTTVFGGDVVISGTLFGGSPLYVGTFLSASAGAEIGGTTSFTSAPTFNAGLSGSLTKLRDGTSYLIAGANVTITTGTLGNITISSTGGGGGGTGTNFFTEGPTGSPTAGVIYNSGSVAFTGDRTGENISAASQKGTDVIFYFSGSNVPIDLAGTNTSLFGGNLVTSASYYVKDSGTGRIASYLKNDGTVSGSGNFSVGGSVLVAGNITATDTTTSKTIFSTMTSNTITIGGAGSTVATDTLTVGGGYGSTGVTVSSAGNIQANGSLTVDGTSTLTGNVTVSGDLTVNGTTTTVNSTTVSIQDAVIGLGFTSGSTGRVAKGDRGLIFAGDPAAAPGNLAFIWDDSDSSFAAISTIDSTTSSLPVNVSDYRPLRASKFTLGNSFLTSSNGVDVDLFWGSTPTNYLKFTKDGSTPVIQGVQTAYDLVITGSSLALRHGLGAGSVAVYGETTHGLGFEVRGSGASLASSIISRISKTAGVLAGSLTVSGSVLTLGDQNYTAFERLGSEYLRASSDSGNSITTIATPTNRVLTIGASGTGNLILSGTAIQFNASVGGQSFRREGTEFLLISSGAAASTQRSLITAAAGKTLVVGGTSETILSGSSITLLSSISGNPFGVDFSADVGGTSQSYLNISSGSYSVPAGIVTANAAKIVPGDLPNPHDLLVGASVGKNVFLSGSSVRFNAGTTGIILQRDGLPFVQFSSGSAGAYPNIATVATPAAARVDLFNTTATVINFAGAGTDISIGASSSGATYLKNSSLFISGSTTVAGNILPNADMAIDLGQPGLRFRNMYTGDLHLRNDRGNWTIIEEREFLSITNNITGKRYKFVLQELE